MGNTSSQLAAPATQVPATQSPSQLAWSLPQSHAQPEVSDSSPGSEIAVSSPRSKTLTSRAAPAQRVQMERDQSAPADVEAKPKKRARSSGGGSGRAPRGRPRDPSLLKREVAAKPADIPKDSPDAGAQPAPAKKRKLSKADQHMLQIASAMQLNDDAKAGAMQEDIRADAPKRKAKKRKTQQAELAKPVLKQEVGEEDAQLPTADAPSHQPSGRISEVGKPGPNRKRSRVSSIAAVAATAEDAGATGQAKAPARSKHRDQSSATSLSAQVIPETAARPGHPLNVVAESEASAAEEAVASASEESMTRKRKREEASESKPAPNTLSAQPQVLPASDADEQPAAHANERRVSAIGKPGPQKRKKTKAVRAERAAEDAATAPRETQPAPQPTSAESAQGFLGWPDAKVRHLGEGIAHWLEAMPKNAGRMPNHEEAIKICEPKTTLCDLARALKRDHGLRFRSTLLTEELIRLADEWDADGEVSAGGASAAPPAQPNPTPPRSPSIIQGYGVDATDQVKQWLSSQDVPVSDPNSPASCISNERRDNSNGEHHASVPEHVADAVVQPPQDAHRKPSNSRKPNIERSCKVDLPAPLHDGPESGQFTDREKAAVDDVFEYVRQKEGLDALHMKAAIIDWATANEFKVEVQEALPNRTKDAIRKFCHRRYTADATGPWTAEEDERLRRAYAQAPNKWSDIADLVNRNSGACRDRWRDHLQYGDKRLTGPWSQDEERKLVGAVQECLKIIMSDAARKGEIQIANDVEKQEQLLDWKTISDRLESTRSKKNCREKWQSLKRRNPDIALTTREGATAASLEGSTLRQTEYNGKSNKQERVESKVQQFQLGDYYDVLVEIYTALDDNTKTFADESTFWSIVATKHRGSRFSGALRRRAYYVTLENYASAKKVSKAATIAEKARAMARSLTKWAETNSIEEYPRGYTPPDKEAQKARRAQKAARKAARKAAIADGQETLKKKATLRPPKSKEYVVESEEEGEAEQEEANAGPEHESDAADQPSDASTSGKKARVGGDLRGVSDRVRGNRQAVDDFPMSSMNSRYEASLSGREPNLGPAAFMARCQALGRHQRRLYQRQGRTTRT